jgi:hypothetical protein
VFWGVAFPVAVSAITSFLRCGGAISRSPSDGLDPRNVLAQAANLLQALGLAHVQLKLQLEQLVREIALPGAGARRRLSFVIQYFESCRIS